MTDIRFQTQEYVFSYRVAGICIQNGKILLQKPENDTGYAFPGGHVSFGETNQQTLEREFREEMNGECRVGELMWVGELFFPWGKKKCHQICLYYGVSLQGRNIPTEGTFLAKEQLEGQKIPMVFTWVPLEKIEEIPLYPTNAIELLEKMPEGVQHFIYRED